MTTGEFLSLFCAWNLILLSNRGTNLVDHLLFALALIIATNMVVLQVSSAGIQALVCTGCGAPTASTTGY